MARLFSPPTYGFLQLKTMSVFNLLGLISLDWWKNLWETEKGIEIINIREMLCCKQSWDEWHTSYWQGIEEDIKMREAENGKYYNLIQMIAKVI